MENGAFALSGANAPFSIIFSKVFRTSLKFSQNVRSDLVSKMFDTLKVFQKDFFEKVDFEKKSADDKRACKITQLAKS